MSTAQRVGDRLAALRAAGLQFDEAWPAALAEVRDASWRRALEDTRAHWAAGYHRRSTGRDGKLAALLVLAGDFDVEAAAEWCPSGSVGVLVA